MKRGALLALAGIAAAMEMGNNKMFDTPNPNPKRKSNLPPQPSKQMLIKDSFGKHKGTIPKGCRVEEVELLATKSKQRDRKFLRGIDIDPLEKDTEYIISVKTDIMYATKGSRLKKMSSIQSQFNCLVHSESIEVIKSMGIFKVVDVTF